MTTTATKTTPTCFSNVLVGEGHKIHLAFLYTFPNSSEEDRLETICGVDDRGGKQKQMHTVLKPAADGGPGRATCKHCIKKADSIVWREFERETLESLSPSDQKVATVLNRFHVRTLNISRKHEAGTLDQSQVDRQVAKLWRVADAHPIEIHADAMKGLLADTLPNLFDWSGLNQDVIADRMQAGERPLIPTRDDAAEWAGYSSTVADKPLGISAGQVWTSRRIGRVEFGHLVEVSHLYNFGGTTQVAFYRTSHAAGTKTDRRDNLQTLTAERFRSCYLLHAAHAARTRDVVEPLEDRVQARRISFMRAVRSQTTEAGRELLKRMTWNDVEGFYEDFITAEANAIRSIAVRLDEMAEEVARVDHARAARADASPPHIKKMNSSHGLTVGDKVTWRKDHFDMMSGTITSITASRLWSNGGVPMAKIAWSSGGIGRHTITQLKKI